MTLRFILLMLVCGSLYLDAAFYEDSGLRGFYFFEDKKDLGPKEPTTPENAVQIIQEKRRALFESRCLAILSPSEGNIKEYLQRQDELIRLSSKFAQNWQYVLLDSPELSDSLDNPTSYSGIEIRKEIEKSKRETTLKSLSDKFFLLLFIQGNDPYSDQAGRVAQYFCDILDWELVAISLDNKEIKTLPHVEHDKGISQKYGVQSVPAFFIVNPETGQSSPLGIGPLTVDDLIENTYFQIERSLERGLL